MRLNISVSTNIGKRRSNNEDNFYADGRNLTDGISDDFSASFEQDLSERRVYAVCDGMGGEAFGELASSAAVRVLGEYREMINKAADIRELEKAVDMYANEANARVLDEVTAAGGDRGGTTLTLACVRDGKVYMYYLGDSRIYMLRNGVLTRLSRDHTVAYNMVDSNVYSEEEAERSPDRHKLTMYLGSDEEFEGLRAGFAGSYTLTPGDRYLLCSDGLNEMCGPDEIKKILSSGKSDTARRLVGKALENGGSDNVTCLVIEVKK